MGQESFNLSSWNNWEIKSSGEYVPRSIPEPMYEQNEYYDPPVGGNGDRSSKVVRSTARTIWLHIYFMQYIKEKVPEFWLCIFQPFDGKDAFNNWLSRKGMFGYVHGIIKFIALITLHVTTWGSRRWTANRRDQEKSLEDSERIRKRYTQIDIKGVVSGAARNQMGLSAAGQAQERRRDQTDDQSGRELVIADPGSNAARNPQASVNDQTTGRQEKLEQERLEREKLQEGLAQRLREQEKPEQEKQEKDSTPLARENLGFIRITFKVRERGV
ncbi:hypothetical protein BDZ45DRAFT_795699 [Acephala macrosclerotiorum]|nr:hypothetical protein BDZ45DRAFT_795699 [Acephala macrosclerotiorum]